MKIRSVLFWSIFSIWFFTLFSTVIYIKKNDLAEWRLKSVLIKRLELAGRKRKLYQKAQTLIGKDPAMLKLNKKGYLDGTENIVTLLSRMCILSKNGNAYSGILHRLKNLDQKLNDNRYRIICLNHIIAKQFPGGEFINLIKMEVL